MASSACCIATCARVRSRRTSSRNALASRMADVPTEACCCAAATCKMAHHGVQHRRLHVGVTLRQHTTTWTRARKCIPTWVLVPPPFPQKEIISLS